MEKDESPIIKVIGVGGGGSNAVTHMFKQGIVGVDFAICNTDSQAMELSPVPTRMQLGPTLTEGRGAGSKPNIGKMACEESIEDVQTYLENNCKMLFITAGMGGGTGTGAAPIIAKTAQELDILTVGIVTLPFTFEGRRRSTQGIDGLNELKNCVDTLIVISNDKLRQIHGNLSISEAFAQADNILTTAAKGIAEIITVPGHVNVDFEDVNTVMRKSGVAIMGTASAEGEDRAKVAVDEALHSPLLEENDIRGAQHILLNITSGTKEVTMDEIFEITEFVQEEAGFGTDLIWGNCYDESLGEKISVTVIATGFENHTQDIAVLKPKAKKRVDLDEDSRPSAPKNGNVFDFPEEVEEKTGNTVEFTGIHDTIYARRQETTAEEASNGMIPSEEERRKQRIRDEKRRERNRNHVVKLTNPKAVIELENEPAYLRRGIELDDLPNNRKPSYSRFSIADEEPRVSDGNAYLHDNVD